VSLAPPPIQAWNAMPAVWRRWFQALFARVGGSAIGGSIDVSLAGLVSDLAPLASPALTGTPTAPTAAADANSTQLATTAFVVGQAASATPVMDGSAAAGASTRYARADHVHPADTSKAPLASPAFTGTPTAPTPAAGDNSTKIATTAFVVATLAPPRATVDVTAGTPGSVAIVGTASGISGVSIVTVNPPNYSAVRFTFTTAMADTNYVATPAREYIAADASSTRQPRVLAKAVGSFDVGWSATDANGWGHIDEATHRFSVSVSR
jgi:hypothetical protein